MNEHSNKTDHELKPCPFCGGEAKLKQKWGKHEHRRDPITYAWCKSCKARSLPFIDEKDAVEAWNRRTGVGV